jgi:hypothetical protein
MTTSILTAKRTSIELGDIPLNCYLINAGTPDVRYVLAGRNVTDAIKEDHKSLGRIMGVKSLKTLPHADKACPQIKSDTGETFVPVAIEDATEYWKRAYRNGNDIAGDILSACAIEAIERRADKQFNIERTEEERNERFVQRQAHLKQFHPLYTSWLKADGVTATYGTEVNNLKEACKLPLVCVDQYSVEQLAILNQGEASYNSLRIAGLSHEKALQIVSISR